MKNIPLSNGGQGGDDTHFPYPFDRVERMCRDRGSATKRGVAWLNKKQQFQCISLEDAKKLPHLPNNHIEVVLEYTGADWTLACADVAMLALGVDIDSIVKPEWQKGGDFLRLLDVIRDDWSNSKSRLGKEIPRLVAHLVAWMDSTKTLYPRDLESLGSARRLMKFHIFILNLARLSYELGQVVLAAQASEQNPSLVKLAAQKYNKGRSGSKITEDLKTTLKGILDAQRQPNGHFLNSDKCLNLLVKSGKTEGGRRVKKETDDDGKILFVVGDTERTLGTMRNLITTCKKQLQGARKRNISSR